VTDDSRPGFPARSSDPASRPDETVGLSFLIPLETSTCLNPT
jgi:hypothetical protein